MLIWCVCMEDQYTLQHSLFLQVNFLMHYMNLLVIGNKSHWHVSYSLPVWLGSYHELFIDLKRHSKMVQKSTKVCANERRIFAFEKCVQVCESEADFFVKKFTTKKKIHQCLKKVYYCVSIDFQHDLDFLSPKISNILPPLKKLMCKNDDIMFHLNYSRQ